VAFQRGLSGGFSRSRGGNRRLQRGFRGAGLIKPPAGTYDPGLDAGQRAATRGFGDLRMDLDRDTERSSTAFTLGTQRLGEDEAFQMGELNRSFANRATAQNEQAAAMLGGSAGGAMAEAAGKRDAAKEIQRGRMATMFSRARDDMGTEFQYGQDDRAMTLGRAGRENTFYGQDVADQRYFQAAQAGWRPPAKPKKRKGRR
jgi:hypothetical protein